MITSSPTSQVARMALRQECFAPLLTMIWLGLYSSLLSFRNFSEIAWRSSIMPELGVYLVKPVSIPAIAAALMCSGVSKSGSPAPNPQTSSPSAFMALALLCMERGSDGVSDVARGESSMMLWGCWLLIGQVTFNYRL